MGAIRNKDILIFIGREMEGVGGMHKTAPHGATFEKILDSGWFMWEKGKLYSWDITELIGRNIGKKRRSSWENTEWLDSRPASLLRY